MPRRSTQLSLLLFSCYVLASVVFLNRNTPFRGEHWALLYSYVHSSGFLERMRNVSEFVCFGVQRFQPLAFFPAALTFQLFGSHFWLHYVFSVLLHLGYTYAFLRLVDRLRREPSETPRQNLFLTYPLEAALFLVAFPAADVLLWSFFHYVQIAILLATLSLSFFLDDKRHSKSIAYALIFVASLIYEPFLSLVACYALWGIAETRIKRRFPLHCLWPILFLLLIIPKYYTQYSAYRQQVASYNQIQSDMVMVPFLEKAWFCFEKLQLMIVTTLYNLGFPTNAVRKNIYEMPIVPLMKNGLYDFHSFTYLLPAYQNGFAVGFTVVLGLLAALYWKKRKLILSSHQALALLYGCAVSGPFLAITWARPVVRDVSIAFQFRYLLVGLAPLVCLLLEGLFRAFGPLRRPWYAGMIVTLILINSLNTLKHGFFVREDMADLISFVDELKARSLSSDEVVTQTTNAMTALKIPSDPKLFYFDYNAQKCVAEWKMRTDLSEKKL
jgi:hypothetical protein